MYGMHMYMWVRVLCCCALFVCLTLLASFFLPFHLSFKNMYNTCDICLVTTTSACSDAHVMYSVCMYSVTFVISLQLVQETK